MQTQPDLAPLERRPKRTQVASMLVTFLVVVALVPGAAVLALTWLTRALSAGWGPVLGGVLIAATWPAVSRASRELTGRSPRRPAGLPGWLWLGLGGTLACWVLF